MTDPKYMRHNLPFALAHAIEEAGELLAAMGKTLRWGWESVNPELPPDEQETNADWVRREIDDVRESLDALEREMKAASDMGVLIIGAQLRVVPPRLCHFDKVSPCNCISLECPIAALAKATGAA